jgi:hypothetical protein
MTAPPDPRKVEAGKRARARWRGFTPEGLERLRQGAIDRRLWEHSTGPRTPAGKARSSANSQVQRKGPISAREMWADMAAIRALIQEIRDTRDQIAGTRPGPVPGG